MATFIPVSQVTRTNFFSSAPKTISRKPPSTQKYTRTYLQYNYGTPEEPKAGEPLFELKITEARIRRKEDDNGNVSWKLIVTIKDQNDLRGLSEIDMAYCMAVEQHRAALGMPSFSAENPGDTWRNVWFYPADPDTHVRIENASPLAKFGIRYDSKFEIVIDQNGNTQETDYKALENKVLTASIVISANNIYKAGHIPYSQTYVRSCMIVGMSERGAVNHTKSDIVRQFLQSNPDMINTLAEQIEQLKQNSANQSSLLTIAPPPVQNQQVGSSQPVQNQQVSSGQPVQNQQFSAQPVQNQQFSAQPALPQQPVQNPQFQVPQNSQANQHAIQQQTQAHQSPVQPSTQPQVTQIQPSAQTGPADLNAFLQSQNQPITLQRL